MPRGVYKHKRGYKRAPYSDEWRANMSAALKGRVVWNKGKKTGYNPKHAASLQGRPSWNKGLKTGPLSEDHKQRMSDAQKSIGNKPPSFKGKKRSIEFCAHASKIRTGKPNIKIRGANNPLWKGGITPVNARIRTSLEYKNWRRAVYSRDNYSCVFCGKRGGSIEADHIKPFSLFPELRFVPSNGRTLCAACHKKTDTYGRRVRHKTREEFSESPCLS